MYFCECIHVPNNIAWRRGSLVSPDTRGAHSTRGSGCQLSLLSLVSAWVQPLAPKDRAPPANKCADCLQEPQNLASCAGFPLINPGCKWPFPVTLSLLYDTLTGEWWARGPALDWLHLSFLCERTTTIRPHFIPDLEAEVGHLPGPGLKSAGLSWLPCSSHLPIGPSLGLSCVSYPSLGGFVVGNVTPVSCSPCSLKHSLPKICIELCFHWSIHQSPISPSNSPPVSHPCTTHTSLHPPNHPPVIHSSTQLSIHPLSTHPFIHPPINPSIPLSHSFTQQSWGSYRTGKEAEIRHPS